MEGVHGGGLGAPAALGHRGQSLSHLSWHKDHAGNLLKLQVPGSLFQRL